MTLTKQEWVRKELLTEQVCQSTATEELQKLQDAVSQKAHGTPSKSETLITMSSELDDPGCSEKPCAQLDARKYMWTMLKDQEMMQMLSSWVDISRGLTDALSM